MKMSRDKNNNNNYYDHDQGRGCPSALERASSPLIGFQNGMKPSLIFQNNNNSNNNKNQSLKQQHQYFLKPAGAETYRSNGSMKKQLAFANSGAAGNTNTILNNGCISTASLLQKKNQQLFAAGASGFGQTKMSRGGLITIGGSGASLTTLSSKKKFSLSKGKSPPSLAIGVSSLTSKTSNAPML